VSPRIRPGRRTSGEIRRATPDDANAVADLRLAAYSGATEFTVREPSTLQWTAADEENIVLAAWAAEGDALSTTRGDVLLDSHQAEQWMECSLDRIPIGLPTLLLGKGATRKPYERQGFHSALRFCFLAAARDCEIESLTGIVYEDAPRTRLMHRIGYDFYEPTSYWYTDLKTTRRTLIAVLPRPRFAQAIDPLREMVGSLLDAYPCEVQRLTREVAQVLGAAGESVPAATRRDR
jgi:hypothetical protein